MKSLVAIAILIGSAASVHAQGDLNFKVIEMPADFSSIREYKVTTIRTQMQWKSYWSRFVTANVEDGQGGWKPMPRPEIDFRHFEVVAVHLGPQDNAGKIKVLSATQNGGDYSVTLDKDSGGFVMHHTANPAVLIRLPRSQGQVKVIVKKGRQADDTGGGIRGIRGI